MALSPGWLRTELALRAEPTPYIGRAVVAPARNGQVMRKSGRTLVVGELAYVYGLTVQLTAGRAVAVPDAAHRARLGSLGDNASICARMTRKSSVSGASLPPRSYVTDQAAPIDEEA